MACDDWWDFNISIYDFDMSYSMYFFWSFINVFKKQNKKHFHVYNDTENLYLETFLSCCHQFGHFTMALLKEKKILFLLRRSDLSKLLISSQQLTEQVK